MQGATHLTVHAEQRRHERQVPPSVMQELGSTAARFLGHERNGRRIELRIVKHGETFWIAPTNQGVVITVYAKQSEEMRRWAHAFLVHPEQSWPRLLRLRSHRTPEEQVTDELERLWGGAEHVMRS